MGKEAWGRAFCAFSGEEAIARAKAEGQEGGWFTCIAARCVVCLNARCERGGVMMAPDGGVT